MSETEQEDHDDESDVDVEVVGDADLDHIVQLPGREPGTYWSTTDAATDQMSSSVRHLFKNAETGDGYDSLCGRGPKNLAGKGLDRFSDVDLLLGRHRLCTTCANRSGIRNQVRLEDVKAAYEMYDPDEINFSTGKQNIKLMFGVEIPPGDPRGGRLVDSMTALLDALEAMVTMKTPASQVEADELDTDEIDEE